MTDLIITPTFSIPASELDWAAVRSSGPGGQNVNKVNSKVTLRWRPVARPGFDLGWRRRFVDLHRNQINREGELVVHCDTTRDQSRNLLEAQSRLRQWLLDCRFPPKVRKATRPSLGSKRRRLDAKRQTSEKKRLRSRPGRDD